MKKILSLLFGATLASCAPSPAYAADKPVVLPDSDTSSITQGVNPIPLNESPFKVVCTTAKIFNERMHKIGGKGMIIGKNDDDGTLIMVIRATDGSAAFARSDWNGKRMCIFGIVGDMDIDLGVVLLSDGRKHFEN
jgi:hypothetical protein